MKTISPELDNLTRQNSFAATTLLRYGVLAIGLFCFAIGTGVLIGVSCGQGRDYSAPQSRSNRVPGRVQLDIIMTQGVGYDATHTLSRELAREGIENVTLRQQKPADAISMTNTGTERYPNWRVIAVLDSSGTILLPDGTRISSYQPSELARWIRELPQKMEQKKEADLAPELSDFGISAAAVDDLMSMLKGPLAMSTKDEFPLNVLYSCIEQTSCPFDISKQQLEQIKELDPVSEELQGMSCGTVMAYLLRPAGLALVPRQTASGAAALSVESADPKVKPWPIGFKVAQRESIVLPDIVQMVTTGINRTPASRVIVSLGERINVPLLYDYNAMARHGIELDKVIIDIPTRQMSYLLLFHKVLTRSRMKAELRMDEAGRPFYWITTIKPI